MAGRNLLEQVVGSYMGALVQREHIKNKRLDDLVTSAGNYDQNNLQSSLDKVRQKTGAALELNTSSIGPTVDYGDLPRQLGVTPFPAPPPTINVNDEKHSFSEESQEPPQSSPVSPPPPPVTNAPPSQGSESPKGVTETVKKAFPWWQTIAGTALAASVATNGYLLYKSGQPASTDSIVPPANNTDIYMDSGMGSVSIGVE